MIHHLQRQHILFDLDHTIMDAARRDHMIAYADRTGDWHAYHSDLVNDTVCHDIHEILTAFRHADFHIIGITARPERYRKITMETLELHKVWLDELLMHKRDAWEPSAELKIALVKERFGKDFANKILCIIDDHSEVVKAFQAAGVTALQVFGRKYE